MKTKLVGIFVLTLLIATAMSAVGTMTEREISTNNPGETLPLQLWGLDQKQTHQDGWAFNILPAQWLAQGFKPTVEKLTAVQLYIFKHDNPPAGIEITVSIRDSLNGSDLTITSENADQIKKYKWVWFDFPDINVTPEKQYYIVCRSDGGASPDVYCWFYGNNNSYDGGDAWMSADEGLNWSKLESGENYQDPDFCFKTYSKNPRDRSFDINRLFLRFLENHPHMFPLLRYILRLQ